jgi:phosphate/sulfate permease
VKGIEIMGLPGMVLSGIATAVGAIMYWAVTAQSSAVAQSHGFRLSTVGVILMIAGLIGFAISTCVFVASRHSPSSPTRTFDREVIDSTGRTTEVHEKQN